jgi:hypothetical protein
MLMLALLLASCGQDADEALRDLPQPDATCDGIYGAPSENTGLDDSTCVALIAGDHGTWTPPAWDTDALAALRAWTLLDPPAVPDADPYAADPAPVADDAAVCVMVPDVGGAYRVETRADPAALAAGEAVTHGGACGLCSSLADLAVYAGIPDLTQPVRDCGLLGALSGPDATEACLLDLGFTAPCARIWTFNTEHTREVCLDVCLSALDEPYNLPDGSLNDCLQCDEDQSGPVFKAVAGRTRRNSGLATALCRPCETVWRVDHDYPAL